MNDKFKKDFFRMTAGQKWGGLSLIQLVIRYDIRYLYFLRMKRNKFHTIVALRLSRKYGLEIMSDHIGAGLFLGHAHNINVNPDVVIGCNCNLNKGCTIGRENRGIRDGVPTLGNQVWVGTNVVIVGRIKIGDDVLIAPNAYVNFDVPSHSIVIGNPGQIYARQNATEGYVCNLIDG